MTVYQGFTTIIRNDYLATHPDKLGGKAGKYLGEQLIPDLEKRMQARNIPMSPYVTAFTDTPDKGFGGFLDTPRYSTGYTSLFGTLSFIVETHMLKPFKQRVEAIHAFMQSVILHAYAHGETVRKTVSDHRTENILMEENFVLRWKPDKTRSKDLTFLGYEATKIKSKVTGLDRTYYDRSKPFKKIVPYYNFFLPDVQVSKPLAYLIPQGWQEVITCLQRNGVKMNRLSDNVSVEVQAYYIGDFETSPRPFEGHYLHSQVKVRKEKQELKFLQGDYVLFLGQESDRYVVETLEPQGVDSFFTWNFFDSVLQQKEYFSDYVFEEVAEKLLAENADLKQRFEAKKQADKEFAQDAYKQLDFIYKNSPHYERTHLRYPVFRLEKEVRLPLE